MTGGRQHLSGLALLALLMAPFLSLAMDPYPDTMSEGQHGGARFIIGTTGEGGAAVQDVKEVVLSEGTCPMSSEARPTWQAHGSGGCSAPGACKEDDGCAGGFAGKGGPRRNKARRSGIHPHPHFAKVEVPHVAGYGDGEPRIAGGGDTGTFQESPLPPPPWGFPSGVHVLPSFLSWEDQHVCTTAQTTLRIINLSNTTDLAVHGATSSCFDFYMAELQDTRVPPNAVFFLHVFFLPRTLGLIDGNLTVHTSAGPVVVPLYGNGLPSPYGLEPKVSLRALVGQRVRHSITLSNPFEWPIMVQDLQKKEDFYLSGLRKAEACNCQQSNVRIYVGGKEIAPDPDQWAGQRDGFEKFSAQMVVEPGQKREVMEVELGHSEMGRLSASIFLRLASSCKQEYLLIPIDLTTAWGGVFPTEDEVNFGTLTSLRQTVVRHLRLANTGSKSGSLEEIRLTSRDENFVQVRFRKGQVLYPSKTTVVAELKYQALNEPSPMARTLAVSKARGPMGALAYADEWWKVGKLIIKINHKNSSSMEVAYRARVVLGSVKLEPAGASVFVLGFEPAQEEVVELFEAPGSDKPSMTRTLRRISHQVALRNTFSCPVLVYAGYFSHGCVEAPHFPVASLIPAGGTSQPFMLHILPDRVPSVPFVVTFSIATNVSEINIYLHIVSGALNLSLPEVGDPMQRQKSRMVESLRASASSAPKSTKPGAAPAALAAPRVLDLGLVQVGHTLSRSFNLSSPSPLAVPVTALSWSNPMLSVRLAGAWKFKPRPDLGAEGAGEAMGTGKGVAVEGGEDGAVASEMPRLFSPLDGSKAGWTVHRGGDSSCKNCSLFVVPGWHVVELEAVLTATREEAGSAALYVTTLFEVIELKVRFETVSGTVSLAPEIMAFPASFPGRRHKLPIFATSRFPRPIQLRGLSSTDSRFVVVHTDQQLRPNEEQKIGHVIFDPATARATANKSAGCSWKEQMGVPDLAAGTPPVPDAALLLEQDLGPTPCDRLEVEWWGEITEDEKAAGTARHRQWQDIVHRGENRFQTEIGADFEGLLPVSLSVSAGLMLPRITEQATGLNFMRVYVGEVSRLPVRVVNPSDYPVRMQLVLDPASERCQGEEFICRGLTANHPQTAMWHEEIGRLLPAALRWWKTKVDQEQRAGEPRGAGQAFFLEEDAVAELVIPSQGSGTLGPISFRPGRMCRMESTAYVRNNLTFLESVHLQGEGGAGCLRFLEAEGPEDALVLNVTDSALKDPRREVRAASPGQHLDQHPGSAQQAEVRRKFHAQNSGNMPLAVSSISFLRGRTRQPGLCRTQSFSLEPCKAFTLDPGAYHEFTLSYHPDLTALSHHLVLSIESSAGEHFFPVIGRLPRHLIPLLLQIRPASSVDVLVRNVVLTGLLSLLAFLLHCVRAQLALSPAPWQPGFSAIAASAIFRRLSARESPTADSAMDLAAAPAAEAGADSEDSAAPADCAKAGFICHTYAAVPAKEAAGAESNGGSGDSQGSPNTAECTPVVDTAADVVRSRFPRVGSSKSTSSDSGSTGSLSPSSSTSGGVPGADLPAAVGAPPERDSGAQAAPTGKKAAMPAISSSPSGKQGQKLRQPGRQARESVPPSSAEVADAAPKSTAKPSPVGSTAPAAVKKPSGSAAPAGAAVKGASGAQETAEVGSPAKGPHSASPSSSGTTRAVKKPQSPTALQASAAQPSRDPGPALKPEPSRSDAAGPAAPSPAPMPPSKGPSAGEADRATPQHKTPSQSTTSPSAAGATRAVQGSSANKVSPSVPAAAAGAGSSARKPKGGASAAGAAAQGEAEKPAEKTAKRNAAPVVEKESKDVAALQKKGGDAAQLASMLAPLPKAKQAAAAREVVSPPKQQLQQAPKEGRVPGAKSMDAAKAQAASGAKKAGTAKPDPTIPAADVAAAPEQEFRLLHTHQQPRPQQQVAVQASNPLRQGPGTRETVGPGKQVKQQQAPQPLQQQQMQYVGQGPSAARDQWPEEGVEWHDHLKAPRTQQQQPQGLPKLPSFADISADTIISRPKPMPSVGAGPSAPPGPTLEPGAQSTLALTETVSAPAHLYDIWGNHFSSIAPSSVPGAAGLAPGTALPQPLGSQGLFSPAPGPAFSGRGAPEVDRRGTHQHSQFSVVGPSTLPASAAQPAYSTSSMFSSAFGGAYSLFPSIQVPQPSNGAPEAFHSGHAMGSAPSALAGSTSLTTLQPSPSSALQDRGLPLSAAGPSTSANSSLGSSSAVLASAAGTAAPAAGQRGNLFMPLAPRGNPPGPRPGPAARAPWGPPSAGALPVGGTPGAVGEGQGGSSAFGTSLLWGSYGPRADDFMAHLSPPQKSRSSPLDSVDDLE